MSSLNISDYVRPMRGFVVAKKKYINGEEEILPLGENLVVNTSKQIILRSIYTTTFSDMLSYAKVGTGGAVDAGGLVLKSPTPDLTDLYNPVAQLPITKLSESMGTPSITMLASLDNVQGNGLTINEIGFFSGNNLMFSIKTFSGVAKDSSFSIDFQWIFTM